MLIFHIFPANSWPCLRNTVRHDLGFLWQLDRGGKKLRILVVGFSRKHLKLWNRNLEIPLFSEGAFSSKTFSHLLPRRSAATKFPLQRRLFSRYLTAPITPSLHITTHYITPPTIQQLFAPCRLTLWNSFLHQQFTLHSPSSFYCISNSQFTAHPKSKN